MNPTFDAYWKAEAERWDAYAPPYIVGDTLEEELTSAGIIHFTERELTVNGGEVLLPPRIAWVAAIVLCKLAEQMRAACGSPIEITSWWRPEAVNKKRGGAPLSDHLWACALDAHFQSQEARRKAMKEVLGPLWRQGPSMLSIGVGRAMLHVGRFAPQTLKHGHRLWKYGDVTTEEMRYGL